MEPPSVTATPVNEAATLEDRRSDLPVLEQQQNASRERRESISGLVSQASAPLTAGGSTGGGSAPNKLNISLRDFTDIDLEKIIKEEMIFYDASRAWHNNGDEVLREIDAKKKIVVSKVVYSYGMNNKFVITARSY